MCTYPPGELRGVICLMSLRWEGPNDMSEGMSLRGSKPPFCLMSLLGLDPEGVKYDLFGDPSRGSILRETLNKRGGFDPLRVQSRF